MHWDMREPAYVGSVRFRCLLRSSIGNHTCVWLIVNNLRTYLVCWRRLCFVSLCTIPCTLCCQSEKCFPAFGSISKRYCIRTYYWQYIMMMSGGFDKMQFIYYFILMLLRYFDVYFPPTYIHTYPSWFCSIGIWSQFDHNGSATDGEYRTEYLH